MSLFSIAVVVLLFVRHRRNLARIWAGTENRVNSAVASREGRRRPDAITAEPGGSACSWRSAWSCSSLVVVAGIWLVRNADRPIEAAGRPLDAAGDRPRSRPASSGWIASPSPRRRPAGRDLPAIQSPVDLPGRRRAKLQPIAETQLEGRPVGVVAARRSIRRARAPAGDAKHVEPGWWEIFDLDGKRVGSRHLAGFYPDDLAVSPDGTYLCSS